MFGTVDLVQTPIAWRLEPAANVAAAELFAGIAHRLPTARERHPICFGDVYALRPGMAMQLEQLTCASSVVYLVVEPANVPHRSYYDFSLECPSDDPDNALHIDLTSVRVLASVLGARRRGAWMP